VSLDSRERSDPLVAARPQSRATSLQSCYSEGSHCSSELLDELKENISPLRPSPAKNVQKQNALKKNERDVEKVNGHLLIVEDVGTPLRRTTFIKDDDHCSPKYVTRTPERRIVNVDGFQSNLSSPQAVPDCYATPLRRTTFVKNSPKLQTACAGAGHVESSSLYGKLPRYSERTVLGTAVGEIKSRVPSGSVPCELSEGMREIFRQGQKPDDLLRDVSKSPLILEDRLLHLQAMNQSERPLPERPRRSVASSRCSPSESEYHTAVTTPYDQSFCVDEDTDEFVDSHICSETITGDVSLCQQQLALKSSSDVTFTSNDYMVMETMIVEDPRKLPKNTDYVDHLQADIQTCVTDEYEVHTEVVSEVLKSEIFVTEMITSFPVEEDKSNCLSADVNTVVYEHKMADFEHGENEHQFFHSARSTVQSDDFRYNTNVLSSDCIATACDGDYSAAGYDAYKRLSSTPVLDCKKVFGTETASNQTGVLVDSQLPHAVSTAVEVAFHEKHMTHLANSEQEPGMFRIPFENDTSSSFNSRTFNNVCATPSHTADVSGDIENNNRTYTKSAGHNSVISLSGSRSASRPLFSARTVGIKSTDDEYDGVLPLDMTESGFHDTAVEQPGTYGAYDLPKAELPQCSLSRHPFRVWSDGEMSMMDRGVFSHVGGQTRHMISPGQKRQSLIARLRNDRQHHSNESSDVAVRIGHGKREHLDADSSPVRKRPLIATSKPSECYFSALYSH